MPNPQELIYPRNTVDDEFFHIVCHMDVGLRTKIEHGEFVELERLLPHDPTKKMTDESRLELVNHDGATFFVPSADRDNKITGI